MSVVPPGAAVTMILRGLLGNGSAALAQGEVAIIVAATAKRMARILLN